MVACVNKSLPEFKELVKEFGVPEYVIETLILKHRSSNENLNTDDSYPSREYIRNQLRNNSSFNALMEAKDRGLSLKKLQEVFSGENLRSIFQKIASDITINFLSPEAIKYHLNMENTRYHVKARARLEGRSIQSVMENLDLNKTYPTSSAEYWLQKIVQKNKNFFDGFYNDAISAVANSRLNLENKKSVEDYFTNASAQLSYKILKELRMVRKRLSQIGFSADIKDPRFKTVINQIDNLEEQLDFREFDLGTVNFIRDFYESLLALEASFNKGKIRTAKHALYLGEVISFYRPLLEETQEYFNERNEIVTKKDNELNETMKDFGITGTSIGNTEKLSEAIELMLFKLKKLEKKKNELNRKLVLDRVISEIKERVKDPKIQQEEIALVTQNLTQNSYDDNVWQKLFGSMGKSKDRFLRIYQDLMRDINNKIRNFSYNLGQEVFNKAEELGIDLQTFGKKVIDKNNKYNFVTEYDWDWSERNKDREFKKLNLKLGLPTNKDLGIILRREWKKDADLYWLYQKNKKRLKDTDYISKKGSVVNISSQPGKIEDATFEMTIKDYLKSDSYLNAEKAVAFYEGAKEIYEEYYDVHPDAEKIIKEKAKEWGKNSLKYRNWLMEVSGTTMTGKTYYKAELLIPKKRNEQYTKLTTNEKQFLNYLLDIKSKADHKIPFVTHLQRRPQIKSDFIESVYKKGSVTEAIKEGFNFTKDSDDIMFGEDPLRRADGSLAYNVTTHFIRKVEDPETLTEDVVGSVLMYAQMAENASEKLKIQPEYESLLDVLKERETTVNGKPVDASTSNVVEQLGNFMKSQLYGIYKDDVGKDTVYMFGTSFSISKMLDKIANYIGNNSLAFRYTTALVGTLSATANFNLEKLVGSYIDKGASLEANKIYSKYAMAALQESGKAVKTNKMSKVLQAHFVLQDVSQIHRNLNFTSPLLKKTVTEKGYSVYSPIEHSMKSNVALSLMTTYRLYEGEFVRQRDLEAMKVNWKTLPTYWEALGEKGNDFKYDVNNPTKEVLNMQKRIASLLNDYEGKVSSEDKALAHRHFLLQFVIMFRNWIPRGVQKRIASRGFNYETGLMEEGYYTGTWNFMKMLYGDKIRSLKDAIGRYEQLEPYQQESVKRTMYEILASSIFLTFGTLLNYLSEDDEEEGVGSFILDYAAFVTARVYIEFTTLQVVPIAGLAFDAEGGMKLTGSGPIPPFLAQGAEVINSPITGVTQINTLMEIGQMFEWGEEIESGPFKGYTKGERFLFKAFPGGKGLSSDLDPEASKQYFLNTTLKYW